MCLQRGYLGTVLFPKVHKASHGYWRSGTRSLWERGACFLDKTLGTPIGEDALMTGDGGMLADSFTDPNREFDKFLDLGFGDRRSSDLRLLSRSEIMLFSTPSPPEWINSTCPKGNALLE